jgi:coronatine-insensitive protein 1
LLVDKCKSLVSLRVGETEMVDMVDAICRACSLRELGAGSCTYLGDEGSRSYVPIALPSNLTALSGMWAMGDSGLSMILPIASNLKKLDLKFTLLSKKAYCQVFSLCHALEELQVQYTRPIPCDIAKHFLVRVFILYTGLLSRYGTEWGTRAWRCWARHASA